MIRFTDHPGCRRREKTECWQSDAQQATMTVNSKGDADVRHRHLTLIRSSLPSTRLRKVGHGECWPCASGRVVPPSPRPSAQSQPTDCHCQKYGSSCGGCLPLRWNYRDTGPSFRRVVCFKFLPGMFSTNPIVGFCTGLQITTQMPRNKRFHQRSPPRPWIRAS